MPWSGVGIVIVWATLLGITLAAEPQAPIPKESVQVGRPYFVQYCSACHGMEGRGDGPVAPVLQPPPADLTRIAQRRGGQFPMAEIRDYIDGRKGAPAHGRRDMPVWGQRLEEMLGGDSLAEAATRSYIQLLVEYLKAIQE
jgi:mono/diheme cytochrome c family protein